MDDDGLTGFLCSDVDGFMQHIAQLSSHPELGRALGAAARTDAFRCLSVQRFRAVVLKACQDVNEPPWDTGAAM